MVGIIETPQHTDPTIGIVSVTIVATGYHDTVAMMDRTLNELLLGGPVLLT